MGLTELSYKAQHAGNIRKMTKTDWKTVQSMANMIIQVLNLSKLSKFASVIFTFSTVNFYTKS